MDAQNYDALKRNEQFKLTQRQIGYAIDGYASSILNAGGLATLAPSTLKGLQESLISRLDRRNNERPLEAWEWMVTRDLATALRFYGNEVKKDISASDYLEIERNNRELSMKAEAKLPMLYPGAEQAVLKRVAFWIDDSTISLQDRAQIRDEIIKNMALSGRSVGDTETSFPRNSMQWGYSKTRMELLYRFVDDCMNNRLKEIKAVSQPATDVRQDESKSELPKLDELPIEVYQNYRNGDLLLKDRGEFDALLKQDAIIARLVSDHVIGIRRHGVVYPDKLKQGVSEVLYQEFVKIITTRYPKASNDALRAILQRELDESLERWGLSFDDWSVILVKVDKDSLEDIFDNPGINILDQLVLTEETRKELIEKADLRTIRRGFSKKLHPDPKIRGEQTSSEERLKELNRFFDIITNQTEFQKWSLGQVG
jgi:hypothetical protein